ncbi:MAG TPA: tail fiber domain-containing protein [Pyrinomonadaceae bacterium]|nr:tail fiber domain-containing protein [Pyrinomonadaceae bacterium]
MFRVLSSLFLLLTISSVTISQSQIREERTNLAIVSAGAAQVRWDVSGTYSDGTLTVAGPDGQIFQKQYRPGSPLQLGLTDSKGERLPDGQYAYEIRLSPNLSPGVTETLSAARANGSEAQVQRDLRKRGLLPSQPLVQSGFFTILNGTPIVAGGIEPTGRTAKVPEIQVESPTPRAQGTRHHAPLRFMFDQVIPDDLIVQGSACVGLDCVNNESFGFDTIRLKENNTRLQFDDTSVSVGFPTNNWQIRANGSGSGGGSFLGFVDQGDTGNSETGTIVFEVDAGAPANALRVSSAGKVGIGTATPALNLHMNTTDTPAMRLEQNNGGGFTAQTWDVAGNEANFFVRDITGGSKLPFRIRPGAPTSSIDISGAGMVGIGLSTPIHKLDVAGNMTIGPNFNSSVNVPLNGLIVEGGVGVGVAKPLHKLDVAGNMTIGPNFNSSVTVPLNGLLVEGGVGIGTTSPDQKLTVNGGASKPGGGSWLVFSDERLKNIKGRFNSGLKAVMQLQPIRYEYKPNNSMGITTTGEYIGFGAQQVQKVIPQAVSENDKGYLMVNNDPIVWAMLNAIKEQQQEIIQLKREVRQLRRSAQRRK